MVSLQLVNALLNVSLWALNGVVGRIMESMYVSAAKLQLNRNGKTKATDSSETDVFQWIPGKTGVFGHTRGLEARQTAKWVFVLLLFSFFFLPAELYAETGIDERRDCSPSDVFQKGLCASPWHGHSDVGIASSALLVQKFTWVDQNWDIVYEGVSPKMVAGEVHVEAAGKRSNGETARKILVSDSHVSVSSCKECGTLTVGKDDGAFDTIITNASLASSDINNINEDEVQERCPFFPDNIHSVPLSRGDLTYDFETGLAFFFWALPCEETTLASGGRIFKLKTRGIEALLNDGEVKRVLRGKRDPWTIFLSSSRTRVYDINCESPGLGWKDLTKAISLYRTVQMEQPGLQRTNVSGDIRRVPPLSSSDVLKSLFALKAEDVRSKSCSRNVPQYQECGSYAWSRAWIYFGLYFGSVAIWIALRLYSCKDGHISLPHNTASWRHRATREGGERDIEVVVADDRGVCITVPDTRND